MLTKRHNRRLTIVLVVLAALILLWPHRPWNQTGETSIRSQYTGTFGGQCDPNNQLVCICNNGQSVCVDGESFVNGLKPHVRLPINGTPVVVKVDKIEQHGIVRPTVVSIEPANT